MSMTQKNRLTLQQNYKKLIEVNYSVISPNLISSLVIDLDMHADIESCSTERKKMEKLLCLLPSRGDRAMKELINAVRPNYGWIATKLEEDSNVGNTLLNRANFLGLSGLGDENTNNNFANLKDFSISAYVRPILKLMQKSVRLCKNWYLLAHSLGLEAHVMSDIQRDMSNLGGTAYAIQSTIQAWISKCGPSKATFGHLIQILEAEDMNEVTEGVVELWTSLQ